MTQFSVEQSKVRARTFVFKQDERGDGKSQAVDPWKGYRGELAVLNPPHLFNDLYDVVEESNILPACVEAMEINIDSFGFNLVKRKGIAEIRKEEIKNEIIEAEAFFDTCNLDYSFTQLRKLTRRDLEIAGNAWWEIIRNSKGNIIELNHLPAVTMKLTVTENDLIKTKTKIRVGLEIKEIERFRRFRRHVQVMTGGGFIYFKELGDPRAINNTDGNVYDGVKIEDEEMANEVIHFKLNPGRSPYGLPRWIGGMASAVGSRASEELNVLYFVNGRRIPLAILVSGGQLTQGSVDQIEDILEAKKGLQHMHKWLLLEAEPAGNAFDTKTGSVKIEIEKLVEALEDDALFQDYDQNNIDKLRTSFRLPKILLGGTDFNRSVADAAVRAANAQVFGPERDEFDMIINRKIFPELGFKLIDFKSKAYKPTDIDEFTEALKRLDDMGVLTPRMIKSVAEEILGMEIEFPESAEWLDRPMKLTIALAQQGLIIPTLTGGEAKEELQQAKLLKTLIHIRKAMQKEIKNELGGQE